MAFSPLTRVHLIDAPLDNKYKNELLFDHLIGQQGYFQARIKHTFNNITYQRKDNKIIVNENIDNLWDSNYVMYQNANFNDKWFYAFITKMEWLSDHSTAVYIETDVFQTWLFDIEIQESFVVREHVSDDTIGKHLVDEQLETGEFVMAGYTRSNKLGNNWNILAVSDSEPMGETDKAGNIYANTVSGLVYYPIPNTSLGAEYLQTCIGLYTLAGKADAIVMIFTVPELVLKPVLDSSWTLGDPIPSGTLAGIEAIAVAKNVSSLDGYSPKNKKLFTYPYNFLYVTNSAGQSATYRQEDFSTETMNFSIFGSIAPATKIMLAPFEYRGYGLKYEYGITLEGFPMGSWSTDTYAAWLAQNGATTAIALIGSGAALAGGVATANPVAIGGGALGVSHELAQIYQASIQPDQAKGQMGGGGLMYSANQLDFYFAPMTIKYEFAKRIDNFFSMYGYKVNTLKVPELRSRSNWNYVQTIDINIVGALPVEDMVRLKRCFDEGITLWHTDTYFLDYSQSNNIV